MDTRVFFSENILIGDSISILVKIILSVLDQHTKSFSETC